MAELTSCRPLLRIGQICAEDDVKRRPADVSEVKRLMGRNGMSHNVLNLFLIAIILGLTVCIVTLSYSSRDDDTDAGSDDTISNASSNKVVDSEFW